MYLRLKLHCKRLRRGGHKKDEKKKKTKKRQSKKNSLSVFSSIVLAQTRVYIYIIYYRGAFTRKLQCKSGQETEKFSFLFGREFYCHLLVLFLLL